MRWKWTEWHVLGALVAILAALFAAGWLTRNDPADQPAIVIAGGGFVFNYREAEAYLGFQAQVMRPLPAGSILEARFEDPAGGDDHVVWERLSARTRLYALRSPPLSEIKAHRPYQVAIRVLDRTRSDVVFETMRSYQSTVSSAALPERPLTIGPGYHRNPATQDTDSQR